MKRTCVRFGLLIALLVFFAVPVSALGESAAQKYENALALLERQAYEEAAGALDALGNYADAPRNAMYARALAEAQKGNWAQGIRILEPLGDFRDALLRAEYFAARRDEDAGLYESAMSGYLKLYGYLDSAQRASAIPDKILAQKYARAEKLEAEGRLSEALDLFRDLGAYSDSAARAGAVTEKIRALAYSAAREAEAAGQYEQAYDGYSADPDYADSAARAEKMWALVQAQRYEDAAAAEAAGQLETAWDAFLSLKDYEDSAERAEAIRQPAVYMRGMRLSDEGQFSKACAAFSSLGDYRDSERKAYVLGALELMDQVINLGQGRAAYKNEGVWGLVSVRDNTALPAKWQSISAFDENGLCQVSDGAHVGLMTARGGMVLAVEWDEIGDFVNGYATVRKNGREGAVNTAGEMTIPCEWSAVSSMRDELFAVYDGRAFGLISTANETVIPCEYTVLDGCRTENRRVTVSVPGTGLFRACKAGLWALMDRTGAVHGQWWASIGEWHDGLALVRDGSAWGYIGVDGGIVAPAVYDAGRDFCEGRAAVRLNGKWGYLNAAGEPLTDIMFDRAEDFSGGYADVFMQGDGWHVIGLNGEKRYFISETYDAALALMDEGRYREAALAFEKVTDSFLAPRRARESWYRWAEERLAAGDLDGAAEGFASAGDYADAQARRGEPDYLRAEAEADPAQKDEYFRRAAAYGFRDAAVRIGEGWYARGEALLEAADFDGAAEAFANAGTYTGAMERRGEVEYRRAEAEADPALRDEYFRRAAELGAADAAERIGEGWYARGEALLEAADFSGAAEAFTSAGAYRDAALQADLAARYLRADQAQNRGDLGEAWETFAALGDCRDSAARAEAVRLPGQYALAGQWTEEGKFAQALAYYRELGDYEDSERRAYVLGVTEFADEMKNLGHGRAAFRWHGVWGLINVYEGTAQPARWDSVGAYDSFGLIRIDENGKSGLADEMGVMVVSPEWLDIRAFEETGWAQVKGPGGWGYIDTEGRVMIEPRWAALDAPDRDGLLRVTDGSGMTGYIDAQDEIVIEPRWLYLGDKRADGLRKAQNAEGLWGYVDETGNEVVPALYSELGQMDGQGRMKAKKDGYWGYVSLSGQTVIPCEYLDITAITNGIAAVAKEQKTVSGVPIFFGLVDEQGGVLIPCEYETLGGCTADIKNRTCTLVCPAPDEMLRARNGQGEWLLSAGGQMKSGPWKRIGDASEGRIIVTADTGMGFIGERGQIIAEPVYNDVLPFREGFAAVKRGHLWGYIALDGSVAIEPIYSQATSFSGGIADVLIEGEGWNRISTDGAKIYFTSTDYIRAEALLRQGKYAEAAALFEQMTEDSTALARAREAWYQAGEERLAAGNLMEAIDAYARAGEYPGAQERRLYAWSLAAEPLEAAWRENLTDREMYQAALDAWNQAENKEKARTVQYDYAVALSELEGEEPLREALTLLTGLGKWNGAPDKALETRYRLSDLYQAAGRWNDARALFKAIGRDDVVLEIYNAEGEAHLAAHEFSAAEIAFVSAKREDRLKEVTLVKAGVMLEEGDAAGAFALYRTMEDDPAVREIIANSEKLRGELKKWRMSLKAGDVIQLGVFEQDNDPNTRDEPIEWIILSRKGGSALMISAAALDARPFHDRPVRISWAHSALRQWLNGEFFETAFSEDAQNAILETRLLATESKYHPEVSSGNDTTDKVFLISDAEYSQYFEPVNKTYQLDVTPYAASGFSAASLRVFWSRSPGSSTRHILCFYANGTYLNRTATEKAYVRPVIWVDLSADFAY